MEWQMDELIEKYWKGETTQEEEQKIKNHFAKNPTFSQQSAYFRTLRKEKLVKYKPAKKTSRRTGWLSAAATITVGLVTAMIVLNDTREDPFAIDDPEEALRATKAALMMIGSELKEGKKHTMDLTKINKAKNELTQEDNS